MDEKNFYSIYFDFNRTIEQNRDLYMKKVSLKRLKMISDDNNYIYQLISEGSDDSLKVFQEQLKNILEEHHVMFEFIQRVRQVLDFT